MPQLSALIEDFSIQGVFESSIALSQLLVKLRLIGHAIEIESLAGAEDDDLFGKVAIVGIVKAIWSLHERKCRRFNVNCTLYKVAYQHLHSFGSFPPAP